ncbi:MAG: helicase-related protein [Myxococcota bacterium]|nr:helicase-related protein [Myxococcota bacterium]
MSTLNTYPPGQRVEIRDEEWLVRRTLPAQQGTAVQVIGLSELVRGHEATFLDTLDPVTVLRPEDTELVPDPSPGHRRSRLYLEALLRRSPPTDPRLVIGHRAAIRESPYQWAPAAQALRQPRPRILMADGVGLGKTIEVGVLLSELIQRGRGQRILVVALKSILAQFQEELWARFTIPLVRLDSVGIQRVQGRIPANQNPFHYFDRVIVSIDTLKKDARYRGYLENAHWDAVVIDECQNVAERGTKASQRARLAQLLARTADALILTSATPHDGRPESFASLMHLLEPTAIADPSQYTKDEVQGLFIRRFQKDVRAGASGSFHERQLGTLAPRCTDPEEAALLAVRGARFHTIGRSRKTDALFRVLLLKALLSSPAACLQTLAERRRKLEKREQTDDVVHDLQVIDDLTQTVSAISTAQQSKLQALFQFLDDLGYRKGTPGKRVVIFSERRATLDMLQEQLAARYGLKTTAARKGELHKWRKGQIATFHGSLPDQEQYALVQDFSNEKGSLRLLLGSDAAAEGLNLHHTCHHLVHFDIPWSLITLEQRNGRIDRFGQSEPPIIRYLLSDPGHPDLQGDMRILKRLIDKEGEAAANLGDVAWLMKLHDAVQEERRIAQAIESGESPESVLPDADDQPQDDDDWLQALLEEEEEEEPETTRPFRLLPSDLEYARLGFGELLADGEDRLVQWEPELSGFVLQMPPDLATRYRYLPPQLQRGKDGRLKLSTDRKRVMDAYAQARNTEDGWPEWELFWEQHPVAEWLNDRVLATFRRHEAPVLPVHAHLQPGQAAYIFQGVLANQRSVPVRVEWGAVVLRGPGDLQLQPFESLAAAVGLDQPLPNTGQSLDTAPLSANLPAAVRAFGDHMRRVSLEYQRDAVAQLRPAVRKLRGWHGRSLEQLQAQQQRLIGAQSVKERQLQQQRQELDRVYKSRHDWIQNSVKPGPPTTRLAAVLVRPA